MEKTVIIKGIKYKAVKRLPEHNPISCYGCDISGDSDNKIKACSPCILMSIIRKPETYTDYILKKVKESQ